MNITKHLESKSPFESEYQVKLALVLAIATIGVGIGFFIPILAIYLTPLYFISGSYILFRAEDQTIKLGGLLIISVGILLYILFKAHILY